MPRVGALQRATRGLEHAYSEQPFLEFRGRAQAECLPQVQRVDRPPGGWAAVLDLVDGKRNVARLIEITGLPGFHVYKTLAVLLDAGHVEVMPAPAEPSHNDNSEHHHDAH